MDRDDDAVACVTAVGVTVDPRGQGPLAILARGDNVTALNGRRGGLCHVSRVTNRPPRRAASPTTTADVPFHPRPPLFRHLSERLGVHLLPLEPRHEASLSLSRMRRRARPNEPETRSASLE
ncbi:hypothetical protein MTO96_003223 [Rhipicephalus appendiculatus]